MQCWVASSCMYAIRILFIFKKRIVHIHRCLKHENFKVKPQTMTMACNGDTMCAQVLSCNDNHKTCSAFFLANIEIGRKHAQI